MGEVCASARGVQGAHGLSGLGRQPLGARPIGEALVLESLQLDALSQSMSASRLDEQTSIGSGTIDFSRMARLNL